MTTKTYKAYSMRVLANGEVRKYPIERSYVVKNTYIIPDSTRDEILRRHADGVPATRIGRDIGMSAERVRRVIKKGGERPGEKAGGLAATGNREN